jgi:hypothetical protein
MAKKKILKPIPSLWLCELADAVTEGVAFIVGNGPSKQPSIVDALAAYGPVFACNMAYREHHVDFLIFQDSLILDKCRHWRGPKFVEWRDLTENERAMLGKTKDIYYYKAANWEGAGKDMHWPQDRSKRTIFSGLSGFAAAQIALLMGYTRLVFVGMDCQPRRGSKDPNEAHALKVITLGKLLWFGRYAKGKGAEVFKYGLEGKLKYQCVDMKDIAKWR